MTSILKRYIIWNINENDNHESTKYFYNDKKKCTSIYLSIYIYIYIYIIKPKRLMIASYCGYIN